MAPDAGPASAGLRFAELVSVMDQLRSPGGCPWDAEQTHRSLVQFLVEETYETVEAIDGDDRDGLREELGDLLLQVVFHARIAAEHPSQPWNVDDVVAGITAKLISRHPHVFGDASAPDAAHVEQAWQQRKASEKGRTSVTDGVPTAMPSLVQAMKVIDRANRGGIEVSAVGEPELVWARSVIGFGTEEEQGRALGQVLLALTAAATESGIDADEQLRKSVAAFRVRIRESEGLDRPR